MIRRLAGALLALWLACGLALAQDVLGAQDYERFAEVATRAEATVGGEQASDLTLNALRAELVRFRARFQEGEGVNSERIATAAEQLAALGPAPAEGETEAADVAARRTELNDQLAELRAPVIAAQEAFERANGLIREIDKLIRARETERLVERGPMPANPANWVTGFAEVSAAIRAIGAEVMTAVGSEATGAQISANLPALIALLVVAFVTFFFAGSLARRAEGGAARQSRQLRGLLLFGASLLRVILPMVGIYATVEVLTLSGIPGFRTAFLIEALPYVGALVIGGNWLGTEAFPTAQAGPCALPVEPASRPGGRRAVLLLAVSLAALIMLGRLDRFGDFSPATTAVTGFVPLVLGAIGLWQLGRRIREAAAATVVSDENDDQASGRVSNAIRALLWRSCLTIAWVGPLLGLVGYMQAGQALVFPMAATTALVLVVQIAQALVNEIYVLLARTGHEASDGLIPVLINLVLAIAAVPVLAVIWGARWVELGELWTTIGNGFTVGESRITFAEVLSLVLVFTLGYMATRALQATLRVSVLPKTGIELGARTALVSGVGYIGIFLAALIAITTTGIDLSSLAIVAGALSVGIGFGLQTVVANFVSGVILLIERPISEGDWIEVGGHTGIVKSISVRSTRIETFDRTDVIVPNQDLISGTVTNWTRGNTIGRLTLRVGVAYGTDTRRVEALLHEIAGSHEGALKYPKPTVVFDGFGADSLDFVVRIYLRDVLQIMVVRSEMNHEIARRFSEEGIEIPFAQRDIWLRNPEALHRTAAAQGDGGETNAGTEPA